ncbi:NADH-quinone oxidoreductase subunit L [Nitrospira sp. BLG_2]|uniref:NADH-quinone oxidoreductase subunit L n=1 Tax=Nitrospira sp. BLG_2 TaxID=3397507 RepID=UPI003B9C7C1C
MSTPEGWPLLVPVLALAIPAALTLAAVASPRRAGLASALALGGALLVAAGAAVARGVPAATGSNLGVRIDAVTCVVLLLVTALGAVVARYSRTYLDGDPELARYQRWLLLTLSAVTALVVANHLLVLALLWTATSLALHQLLTYYSDRPAALVAAHKKFLVSRLADLCLLGCLTLVHRDVGSLDLDTIAGWASSHPELTPSMHAAALLVVAAVALKSAQLPFHGWLTQVMEAPTPVSALLHAGVVNIGGFVLIRLAPWMDRAELAQLFLVALGLASTLVASFVMTTRVSVKVALAWSTCAQMGFMLVECGLGLWHLALLHLVAHSLYKAHAFLAAGSVVDEWRVRALSKRPAAPTWARLGIALFVAAASAILGVVALGRVVALSPAEQRAVSLLAALVSLSLVPLLAGTTTGPTSMARAALRAGGVVLLYAGWHAAAAHWMPLEVGAPNAAGCVLAGLGFAGLFATKTALQRFPDGRLARALQPWLFAGLYLDERFTRFTFRVWPPRLGRRRESPRPLHLQETLEART